MECPFCDILFLLMTAICCTFLLLMFFGLMPLLTF